MSNQFFNHRVVSATRLLCGVMCGLLCTAPGLRAQDATPIKTSPIKTSPVKGLPAKGSPLPAGATDPSSHLETATFGGGCFWCVEAVFENMEGVADVVSGYAGGTLANPSYQQVSTGFTGHAEVCQIFFDPEKVSYSKLLAVFMKTHDPTTRNRQGPDYGTQYRSVIFYHSDEQKASAQELIDKLNAEEAYRSKVVTEVVPFTQFYMAEEYHQDYYRKHPNESYCQRIVRPKVAKFRKVIKELEKKEKKD